MKRNAHKSRKVKRSTSLLDSDQARYDDLLIKRYAKKLGLSKKKKKVGDGFDDLMMGLTVFDDEAEGALPDFEKLKVELQEPIHKEKDVLDDFESDISEEDEMQDVSHEESMEDENEEDIEEDVEEEEESMRQQDISGDSDHDEASFQEDEASSDDGRDFSQEETPDVEVSRKKPKVELQVDPQLVRILRGHVNKISSSSLIKIFALIEELHGSYPRQHINEVLSKHFIKDCVTSVGGAQSLTFATTYAALTSLLHRICGVEAGGTVVENTLREMDERIRAKDVAPAKNLLLLIIHLYNFDVIHCMLMYDIIRVLIRDFSEQNMDLLLTLVNSCGYKLKKDDSTALVDIIQEVNAASKDKGKEERISQRFQYLIRALNELKSSKSRTSNDDSHHLQKQLQMYLNGRFKSNLPSIDQIRSTWDDLLYSNTFGKWGIGVPPPNLITSNEKNKSKSKSIEPDLPPVDSEILKLAKQQRMNTDIRRAIFSILLTSDDFEDAFENIQRLNLRDKSERDIGHVIVHCCQQEAQFNPYYMYLATKFCAFSHSHKVTFKFILWDKLREISTMKLHQLTNLANMYAHLIINDVLNLSILKIIEFDTLHDNSVLFLQILFTEMFNECKELEIKDMFSKIAGNLDWEDLRLGLQGFFVSKMKWLASSRNGKSIEKEDSKEALDQICKVAVKAMNRSITPFF